MMRYLIILLLFPLCVSGQSTYKILADSTRFGSINNTGNELIIQNDTRDSLGVLSNTGTGHTQFKNLRLQQVTDSTFRLLLGTTQQGQTILIPSSGGGSERNVDSAFLFKNAGNDSTCLIIYISGTQYRTCAVDNTGGSGANIYNSNGTIAQDTNRIATIDGTIQFKSSDFNQKALVVGDSIEVQTLPGSITFPIDGVTMYKYYIDTTNVEGYLAFAQTYATGANLVSDFGIRELYDQSENIFALFHPLGQSGADGYYSTWGYINPTTDEAISMDLKHDLANGGFTIRPFDAGQGYKFRTSPYMFRMKDTLQNTFFTATVAGDVGISLTNGNNWNWQGMTTDNSLTQIMSIDGSGNTRITGVVDTMYHITDSIAYTIGGRYYSIADETGGGGVTSVATTDSTGINGGTITTTGTLSLDTTRVVVSKRYLDSKLGSVGATYTLSKNTGLDSTILTGSNGNRSAALDNGWVLLSTASAASSATIEFTGLSSSYSQYKVILYDVVPATDNTNLLLRVGTGAGPTWASNASDYSTVNVYYSQGTFGYTGNTINGTAATIGIQMSNLDSVNMSGIIDIFNPSNTTQYQVIHTDISNSASTYTTYFYRYFTSIYFRRKTAVTGIQLYMSSGNIVSGTFKLYGIK